MGLDITAYSNLKYLGQHVDVGEFCEDEDHIQAYAYESFPQSFRGIPVVGSADGMVHGGCYVETDASESLRFRAGSYGGYNAWRRDLAEQFNPVEYGFDRGPTMTEPDPEKPFYELIWFADNEGAIGPEAAADLLDDFRTHASAYEPPYAYGGEVYENWTRAFELAANGGLVDFH